MDMKFAVTSIVKSFLEPFSYLYEDEGEDESILEFLLENVNSNFEIDSHRRRIPKANDYVEHIIPTLNAIQFQRNFRMLPSTFECLLRELGEKLSRSVHGNDMLAPEKQLMLSLWRFATTDPYSSITERFNVGQATAIRAVRRVSKAICELSPKYIVWPTKDKISEITLGFSEINSFPNVIGAIDSTFVNIPTPKDNAPAFINRKGHYSIHLQGVCDHEGKFTNIYIGNEGSISDEYAFRLSVLQEYINDPDKFPNNTHIIGNINYRLHKCLMTPYFDNGQLTKRQENYNFCHYASRNIIKKAFAYLTYRWKSIKHGVAVTQIDYVSYHILACCVLHNICLLKKDELEELKHERLEVLDEFVSIDITDLLSEEDQDSDIEVAKIKRDSICNDLFEKRSCEQTLNEQ